MQSFVSMKAITKRLRVLRTERTITQRDLALKAGIPLGRYWEIENGYRVPEDDEKIAIARALKAETEDVFGSATQAVAS